MSKLLNKPTPTVNELAKKYGVSVLDVKKQLMHGIKVEKEHTNNTKIAREIALDHLGEKLDYYKKLAKIEEETGSAGVRGLGYVSGDPAGTDYVQQYIDTNAMSYVDENGNKLEWIRKAHLDLHNKGIGYNFFNPKETKTASNFMNEQSLGLSQYSKLNELGGQVGYEGTSDPRSMRKDVQIENRTKGKKMKEDKDPCWKGYEMVGMKKKGGRKVPNCVPVSEQGSSATRYTERPTYEQRGERPADMADATERGIYQEGNIGFGLPYDWAGDRVKRRKVYGTKTKEKPESNEPGTGDTYKDSKQGGRVRLVKKNSDTTVSEDAATVSAMQHMDAAKSGEYRQAKQGTQRLQGNTYRAGQSFEPQGTNVRSSGVRMGSSYGTLKPTTTDVKRNISNRFNPSFSQQGTGSMKASSVRGSTSFSQGGSLSKMTDKLDTVSRGMPKGFVPSTIAKAAPTAAKIAGTVARAAAGPAATAAAAVMSPTPAGAGEDEKKRQETLKSYNPYKAQGRSEKDYEAQVLTPKSYDKPKAENPKVDAPTPPERPKYFSRGQAFSAARGEAEGGSGKFSYQGGSDSAPKTYQTNVSGEPYKPEKQLKQTSVQEDWQSVNRHDKTDGLSQKAVNAYRREHPGSKLKTAVTEKNPTGKRASRRKSFCSRMGGMKKRLTSAKTARDPDSRINKALRRWNCEESTINELSASTVSSYVTGAATQLASGELAGNRNKEQNRITGIETGVRKLHPDMYQGAAKVPVNELKDETLGSYIGKASKSRKKSLEGPKPDIKTWAKREHGIRTAIKKLTKENSKDKDWDAASGFAEQQSHLHLNKPDTKYAPGASGLTHTIHEETKMDNKLINEAIENIMDDNLVAMKENLMVALQEKAMEKLEERKKEIAANYFAQ